MNLIIELLKSLDKYGATTSSVASSYKNDIENVRLKEKVILEYNSKTNYTILQNIMMDEHTLNVCYKIIELYEGSESKTNVTYADIIIAALSHDFGKLIKQVDELIPINTTILQEKSHFEISALYLERVGSELEHLEVIVSAVLNHHSIKEPDAYLSNLLFNADREARSIETKKFLKNKGEKIFDSKIEKKEKVNEEFNAKDGTFNDVKKIDIPIKVINKIEDELKKNINKTTIKNQNGDLLLDRTKINSSFINSISQDDKCYVRFSFFISLTANILKTFCDNNSITDLQDELISYFKEEKIIDNKDKNTVKIEFYDIKDKMIGVENFMKFNLEKLDVDPSEALLKKDKVDLLNNIYIKEV
jgi:predicted HD phosphohydrolase